MQAFIGADQAERARLVDIHLPLVRRVASRLVQRARPYLEADDLVAIGVEAVLRAAERFDADRGVSFATYVYLRVRGAMMEGIGAVGPLSRGAVRKRSGRPEPQGRLSMLRFDERHGYGGTRRAVHEQVLFRIEASRVAPHLARALEALDERDRSIIERHYFGGDTLCEIGTAMGHSRSWASRVHTDALARLRDALRPALSSFAPGLRPPRRWARLAP
jgi:RNA polymerase sigma factor for flagellar operon FliA